MAYPTKEEILAEDPVIDERMMLIIAIWKKDIFPNWKQQSNEQKFSGLKELIFAITDLIYDKTPRVGEDNTNYYNPNTKTIYLDINKPSILSALHETAHYLFGHSELIACRWSIYLFRNCFPGLFKKLTWKGHLLVK